MSKDKNYYARAVVHMEKRGMGFCWGEDGELLPIGKCKRLANCDDCLLSSYEKCKNCEQKESEDF